MKPVRDFEKQLDNLELEATVIANYVYAEMSIHHAASKSRKLLSVLNRAPNFWRTCYAAFQSSAYIALGRVFDLKSPFNIEELITSMESDLSVFSTKALSSRKYSAGLKDPAKLREYVSEAYVPTAKDIQRIRRAVQRRRLVYERAFMHVRHRYLAHRQAHGSTNVQGLYSKGKVKEMWQLSCFLHHLYIQLWQLYHNGRKPDLRVKSRYSPKIIYDKPGSSSEPHERAVRDVRTVMKILESAP